jgi:hypothetical protein
MIFTAFYLIVLLLVYIELRVVPQPRRVWTPALPPSLTVSFLVCSYALQLAVQAVAATHQDPRAVVPGLPIPVVTRAIDVPGLVALLTIALGACQSYVLLAFYRQKQSNAAVGAGLITMLGLSVAAPALTNGDVYAYVGNALLGTAAYSPPSVPFPGEFAVINKLWHLPMTPTTYGPLWLVVARLVTGAFPTLFAKVLAFRLYGGVLLLILLAVLRALGLPARLVGIVALNPAIQLEFVANAHNDLTPILLIALAALVARKRPLAAGALIAVAGLVKLPYVLLGLPVLAASRSRVAAAGLAVALVMAGSWIGGGAAYLHALTEHVRGAPSVDPVHVIASCAALVALVMAFFGRRRLRSAVWLMSALGAYVDSWYMFWGFPYALGRRRVLANLLLWFPLVAALLDLTLVQTWTLPLVASVIVAYLLSNRPGRDAARVGAP